MLSYLLHSARWIKLNPNEFLVKNYCSSSTFKVFILWKLLLYEVLKHAFLVCITEWHPVCILGKMKMLDP